MHDTILNFFWDLQWLMFLKQRVFAIVHLISYSLVYIEQITCALMSIASKSILHDLLFCCQSDSMIIKFPPNLLGAIEKVSVVVTHVRHAIMDHHSVQIVWPFLQLSVWLLESVLISFDLLLQLR